MGSDPISVRKRPSPRARRSLHAAVGAPGTGAACPPPGTAVPAITESARFP